MTGEEAIRLLREKGFEPFDENGVVTICTPDYKDCDTMNRILKKVGYDGSCGWIMKHEDNV